jgi:hypothetical protein
MKYNFKGYAIYVSDKPDKKYYAIVNGLKVYFGSRQHEHYYDKLGYYKNQNHNDINRRENYYKRHKKDYHEGSADWFAKNILW